jgi:hypothetical protein
MLACRGHLSLADQHPAPWRMGNIGFLDSFALLNSRKADSGRVSHAANRTALDPATPKQADLCVQKQGLLLLIAHPSSQALSPPRSAISGRFCHPTSTFTTTVPWTIVTKAMSWLLLLLCLPANWACDLPQCQRHVPSALGPINPPSPVNHHHHHPLTTTQLGTPAKTTPPGVLEAERIYAILGFLSQDEPMGFFTDNARRL